MSLYIGRVFNQDTSAKATSFKCVISGKQLDYKKNNQKRNHC